jgi:hypothetical protein
VTEAQMAIDENGKITGLRVHTIANLGAYLSTFSSSVPTYLYAPLLSGQYNIPAIYAEVDAVYTTTAPVDAYRGAGRPEATFVVERLVEVAARQLGIDPAKFRQMNYITKFPHQTPVIMMYDAGNYNASMKKALDAADYKGFGKRRKEAEKRGKLRAVDLRAAHPERLDPGLLDQIEHLRAVLLTHGVPEYPAEQADVTAHRLGGLLADFAAVDGADRLQGRVNHVSQYRGWGWIARGRAQCPALVVITNLEDLQVRSDHPVDQPVLLGDPARPRACEPILQRLGFTDAVLR